VQSRALGQTLHFCTVRLPNPSVVVGVLALTKMGRSPEGVPKTSQNSVPNVFLLTHSLQWFSVESVEVGSNRNYVFEWGFS
jgi:hypothetical protein